MTACSPFFEIPKGAEPRGNRNAIGAMQHCAFVVTAERFQALEQRLKKAGIECIGPIPQLPGLVGIRVAGLPEHHAEVQAAK